MFTHICCRGKYVFLQESFLLANQKNWVKYLTFAVGANVAVSSDFTVMKIFNSRPFITVCPYFKFLLCNAHFIRMIINCYKSRLNGLNANSSDRHQIAYHVLFQITLYRPLSKCFYLEKNLPFD